MSSKKLLRAYCKMQKLINFITRSLSCRVTVLLFIGGISLFSLLAALASEAFFGLEPCIMCIYQRIPFAAVIILSIIGVIFRKHKGVSTGMIGLSGFAFLINSILALYHTGIEQKWWVSAVEGCKVTFENDSKQTMLENILSAPTGRCDEIPWSDPILNLSMANYNVILCFGLFALCAISLILIKKKSA